MKAAKSPTDLWGNRRWLWLLLPPLLALLVHLPILSSELIWDDEALISQHPKLHEPGFYREIFQRDYGLELAHRAPIGYYRPVLMALDVGLYQAFGKSGLAYHLAVLLAFCFSSFLLTFVTLHALGEERRWVAVAIGCFAAVHPLRTEFAAFFSSMPDLLLEISALAIIGILLGSFGRLRPDLRFALAGAIAMAAALTKETSFLVLGTIGFAMLLTRISKVRGHGGLSLGVAVLVGLAGAWLVRQAAHISAPMGMASPWQLFDGSGRALGAAGKGLKNLLFPTFTDFMSWDDIPATWISATACLLIPAALAAGFAWLLWRRAAVYPALIVAWILGGTISLMMIRANDLPYADRYVPSGALIIAFGLLVEHWSRRPAFQRAVPARISAIVVAGYVAVFAVFGGISTMRCANALGFFSAMAEENPTNSFPRLMLANIWFYRYGDFQKMQENVAAAVALSPDTPAVRAAGKLLASRCIVEGRYPEALKALDWAAVVLPDDPELWSLRATCQFKMRDYRRALEAIDRANALAPDRAEYWKQRERIVEAAATPP